MKKHLKLCAMALSLLGLTACGSVANKTPDEMYRTSIQRQFKQDTQYNFTGKVFAQLLPADGKEASSARDDKLASMIERETHYLELEKLASQETQTAACKKCKNKKRAKTTTPKVSEAETAEIRQRAERKLANHEAMTQHFLDSFSLPVSGAWDLPNGKFEFVPEIRYETRASGAYVKFPIQINAKEANVLIDPAAVSPFIDLSGKKADFTKIDNRYIRIALPEKFKNILPIKDVLHAIPKAVGDAHAVLDKSRFTTLPLDERAKRLGATQRIAYTSNSQQDEAYAVALLKSVQAQLAAKQQNGTAQSNVSAENYRQFLDSVKAISESMAQSSQDVAPVAEQGEKPSVEETFKKINTHTEMYLNDKGRMLAYVQYVDLPSELTESVLYGKRLRIMGEMEMQYNAQPVFHIQSDEKNTVDLEKISPEFKKLLGRLSESAAEK